MWAIVFYCLVRFLYAYLRSGHWRLGSYKMIVECYIWDGFHLGEWPKTTCRLDKFLQSFWRNLYGHLICILIYCLSESYTYIPNISNTFFFPFLEPHNNLRLDEYNIIIIIFFFIFLLSNYIDALFRITGTNSWCYAKMF